MAFCDCLDLVDRGTELFMKFAEPTAALTRKGAVGVSGLCEQLGGCRQRKEIT